MAHVRQHRDVSGDVVDNVWDRVATEGDSARFTSAETGHRQILHLAETAQLADGTNIVTAEPSLGSHLFQLDFDYIVSANQLEVFIPNSDLWASDSVIEFVKLPSIEERNLAALWPTPRDTEMECYYEEIGSSTVRVYGVPATPGIVLFTVPHTSLPAALRNKIIVLDQGDNEAIEFRGDGDGIVFRSPNGSKWLLRIDNNGTPVVEPR